MLEKDIEKILVNEVKKLGGRAYKWVSPGNDGVPDRIVILPGLQPIFVELKTETGRLSAIQNVQIDRLRKMKQNVKILYGESQVRDFLEDCEFRLSMKEQWNACRLRGEEE
ncbi:MAG: VRR-NUC domain-containing protein [Hungatella hathewayi]|uniref:VRR-NUC domain-containing protein n=1 Tax=Hungatella TaxID=1649459 RepID=UPI001105DAAF|nr:MULTISPECIES: VRR-NUC domain-containing protein [Hungatella]MCI7383733.1 VRR-NUC domain-containing protein [Hungatella sp.]MDY6239655.1 VRR-NUC domain-containing protein [Hungatella hathewayi]